MSGPGRPPHLEPNSKQKDLLVLLMAGRKLCDIAVLLHIAEHNIYIHKAQAIMKLERMYHLRANINNDVQLGYFLYRLRHEPWIQERIEKFNLYDYLV